MQNQNDPLFFISHIFDKLQKEQTPKFSSFESIDYDDYEDAQEAYKSKFPSIIDKLFSGMIQKNIRCNECNDIIKKFEVFTHITLELECENLREAYEKHLFHKYRHRDEWKTCYVKSKTVTKEMIELPKYLIFKIKRNQSRGKWSV